MMELVDITDLKSVAIWRPGSSPGASTKYIGVVLMVARWIPNPKVRVQILAPMPNIIDKH